MMLDDEEIFEHIKNTSDFNIWVHEPSLTGWIVYSVIIPVICIFGAIGNFLSVLMVQETQVKDSFFVYLKYLALVNFGSCIIQGISALSNGLFWNSEIIMNIDCTISLPLNNMFTYLATAISLTFIMDRYFLMHQMIRLTRPKFCECEVANKICITMAVIICICSIPFYFIYEVNENKHIYASEFYKTRTYMSYVWFMFITFTVLPALFLIIGITLLTISLNNVFEMKSKCCQRISKGSLIKQKQYKKLVVSLITIVFLFFVGEVPAQAVSRYMATIILFHGDIIMAKRSKSLQNWRILTSILCAINVSSNFPLFCRFCPQFAEVVKYKMKKYRRWPCKGKKNCENIKCLEEGFCNCAFLVQNLSNMLVTNTVKTSFSVIKITPNV